MTPEEVRDSLLRGIRAEIKIDADGSEYRSGYINGVLDYYNKSKEEDKCLSMKA